MSFQFAHLKDLLVGMAKNSIKLQSIPKEDIKAVIETQLKMHRNFVASFGALSDSERKAYFDKFSVKIASSKLPSSTVHLELRNMLTGKAKSVEQKAFLSSLHEAAKSMIKVEEEVLKNIDKFIDKDVDSVTIFNAKMTTTMLFGFLKKSKLLAEFNSFLWAQIITLADNPNASIPKYRVVFLQDNVGEAAEIINQLLNQEGLFYVLREVDSLKKTQSDYVLMVNGTPSWFNFMTTNRFSKPVTGLIGSSLNLLNIFRWAGEKWDNYVHTYYKHMEQNKMWMEKRVALLKLQLADTDPNDPRYQELVKIINSYDDKISDYDAKINEYMESD